MRVWRTRPIGRGFAIDGRVRYTKMVIRQSFLFLLKEQPIEKITVADICRLAEINRATFYRHYENQYGVLYELEDQLLEQAQPAGTEESKGTIPFLQTVFQTLAGKKEEWDLLLASKADPGLPLRLCAFLERNLPPGGKEIDRRFFLHGLSGLAMDWMEGGFQEPAEQMAERTAQYFQDLAGG
mgnify:CR=1 FL=1